MHVVLVAADPSLMRALTSILEKPSTTSFVSQTRRRRWSMRPPMTTSTP